MATAPVAANDADEALEDRETGTDELREVFDRAMRRFDMAVLPQLEQRSLCLMARRFVSIPGAMWEGDFGDMFPDAIKVEINLTKDGLEKIYRDYNENRIVPDFRPANGKGDEESATTLTAIHRADFHCFKAQQALDNAFIEGTSGGMGAYRLTNEWADPYDKDSDAQRINPGLVITDADQRVFFDPDSLLYDKSDAKYGFVITSKQRDTFDDEHDGAISDWTEPRIDPPYDWFTPDTVKVAEYYEVEDADDRLLILTHPIAQSEERYWQSEISDNELAELKTMGWRVKSRKVSRKRVHKYLLSGEEVLADKGFIAGDRIPVAPYYGKRSYVDGVERFEGYVQGKMDINRAYNAAMSKLMETSAQSPRGIPIFLSSQMPPHIADLWARQLVERHSYAVVDPVVDPNTGQIVQMGPIGTVEPAQIDQATAAVLQATRGDLTYDQQDGSDQVRANTSEEAMAFAATRVDAKSGIYLDNWRQTVQCGGEIYLCMASDVYFEALREVETMDDDGSDGTATLVQQYADPKGGSGYRNDFTRGHYKVVVDVTEATATRREKTVKSSIMLAGAFGELGDQDLGKAALITAIANMDGEGMGDLQAYARKQGIALGLIEPTEEEQAAMQQAQEAQSQAPPDPQAQYLTAKAEEAQAGAAEKKAGAMLKVAQATAVGGPDAAPTPPDGLEAAHKVADIRKKVAEARNIEADTEHMPQKLAIEAANARTNAVKAAHQGMLARFRGIFGGSS